MGGGGGKTIPMQEPLQAVQSNINENMTLSQHLISTTNVVFNQETQRGPYGNSVPFVSNIFDVQ